MTPRKFFALLDRVEANRTRSEFGPAQIAAILVAANSDPKKRTEPPTPMDFMPFAKKKKQQEKRMSPDETAAVIRNIFQPAFGGEIGNR